MDKKIMVTQSSMPLFEDYCEEIKKIWDNRWLTNMGPIHNEFREKLIEYTESDNVELFVNGHQALVNAYKSLGIKGEVITTSFTFASTVNAIVEAGLTPVFCDINLKDYTIDTDKIESLITKETCAIAPVHVYGIVCDIEKIRHIAEKYNLKVIYDAAHAFGVKYKNKGIASYGDVTMFSFHATKVFNTIEGGCLCYKDKGLTHKIIENRNFGLTKGGEDVEICGSNAKMNEFQAAMGICNLKGLKMAIEKRKKISEEYDYLLKDTKGIKLMPVQNDVEKNYAYYPIIVDPEAYLMTRDELCQILNENNIFPRKYFYPALNETTAYRGKYKGETPNARNLAENVLCLPIYENLELKDIQRICSIINNKGIGNRL